MPNRLLQEKSPYLQQHADNPVNWFPWGEAAFEEARKTDKPIFLSIGYSTCHWCHVMAHECFENSEIAELMNKHFICIKVDREERPDVDAIYMAFVQSLTGSGGWPLSAWLTPDLKPFYGGTYFPPEDRYGRPGFPNILTQLADMYQKDRAKITETAVDLTSSLKTVFQARPPSIKTRELPLYCEAADAAVNQLKQMFDPVEGGFGRAPKFPMPAYLQFLLNHGVETKNSDLLSMVSLTLEKMAKGGLYDQLGGGFARYSTDATWTVPHFEKMLYDNSQLLSVYAHAAATTKNSFFADIVKETADYITRDLTHPKGGFYSAEDADSEGKEGSFYVWTLAQIKKLFDSSTADVIAYAFGVTPQGNFFDPHVGEEGWSVLTHTKTVEETAQKFGLSVETVKTILTQAKKVLFEERLKRPRPHRDEKIISEWNGLMISALCQAGALLGHQSFVDSARRSALFIKEKLYDSSSKTLARHWCLGERVSEGHQVDYAMLIAGILDLFEVTGEPEWLSWTLELGEKHDQLFHDSVNGGFFMARDRSDLLFRMKDDSDNVIPSGNSIAAQNNLRLYELTGRSDFREKALSTMQFFSAALTSHPASLCSLLQTLDTEQNGTAQIVIVGEPGRADFEALKHVAFQAVIPRKRIILLDAFRKDELLKSLIPWTAEFTMIGNQATAYVCHHFSCKEPVTDVHRLIAQLP